MHCKFCPYRKGSYPWNNVDKLKKKLSKQGNCSAIVGLRKNLTLVQNGPEKRIKLEDLNWSQNKRHTSFSFLIFGI